MLDFRHVQNDDEFLKIYKLRYDVYCIEKNFLDPANYPDELENDEFDQHSAHFLAIDTNDLSKPLGYVRLILNSNIGFPVVNHFQLGRPITDMNSITEISRLIVPKEFRHQTLYILMGLCKEIYLYCRESNIQGCYAVLEPTLQRMLKGFGLPFKVAGSARFYMGADITPVYLNFAEAETVLSENNVLFFEYLHLPRGIQFNI